MIKRFSKRALSLVLALVLIATTFFIFDPDLLRVESDAYVRTEGSEQTTFLSGQTVYATETIYLKPGSSQFQEYANYSYTTGKVASPTDTFGNVYFRNDDATITYLCVNRVYKKGSSSNIAEGTLTVNNTPINGYAEIDASKIGSVDVPYQTDVTIIETSSNGQINYNITSGAFTAHTDFSTYGVYVIEWVIMYVIDGVAHYAFAYTGIYSTPLGQAGITYNGKRDGNLSNPYQMGYTFITGAMKYGGGNAKSNFTNTNVINVANGVGSNTTLTAPLIALSGYGNSSSNYTVPGNNIVSSMQTNTTFFPNATNGGVYRIPDGHQRTNEYASFHTKTWNKTGSFDDPNPTGVTDIGHDVDATTGVAYMVVDTSRYTNYNQIPYLSVGWAQFMHSRDGVGNKLVHVRGAEPNHNDPTYLTGDDEIRANVDTGNWTTGEEDDGRSFTRGTTAISGKINRDFVVLYFEMENGYDSWIASESLHIRTNVGLHTTRINRNELRQQYNNALKTYIDQENLARYAAGKSYMNYYNMVKLVGEELVDPTAHTYQSYIDLSNMVDEYTAAISASFAVEVYFYVPEVIYLTPSTAGTTTAVNFKWFADRANEENGAITSDVANSTTGNVFFKCLRAKNFTITASVPAGCSISGVNLNTSIAGTQYSTTTMTGSAYNTTGQKIVWTVTWTDASGNTFKVERTSTIYKPNYVASGGAGRSKRSYGIGSSNYISGMIYVNGFTNSYAGGSYKVKDSANTSLVPGWLRTGSEQGPTTYMDSMSSGPMAYGESDNNSHTISGLNLFLDRSRYTDYKYIPNFTYTVAVTDYENTNSDRRGYFGYDAESGNVWGEHESGDGLREGVYRGQISGATPAASTSPSSHYVQGYFHGKRSGSGSTKVRINFSVYSYDKSELRTAYDYAMLKSKYLQKDYFTDAAWTDYTNKLSRVITSLQDVEDGNATNYTAYANELITQVNKMVGAVGAPEGSTSFSYNNHAGQAMAAVTRSDVLKTGTATVYHVAFDGTNVKPLNEAVDGTTNKETKTFYYSEVIKTGYNETVGYDYYGFYRNAGTTQWAGTSTGALSGDSAGQGTYGMTGHNSDYYYCQPNLTYTYVYRAKSYGVYMDWGQALTSFENAENLADLTKAKIDGEYTGDDTQGGLVEIGTVQQQGLTKTGFSFAVKNVGYNTRVPSGGTTSTMTGWAKMNDIMVENAATGLQAGETYTISFESTLEYDEYRWFARDMYGNAAPAQDWAHDQRSIQLFIGATKNGSLIEGYTVPVEVKTAITNGGTIASFKVPDGCSNINLGFCITNDLPVTGEIKNVRIVKGDFVEEGHFGEKYTLPNPVWEGYTFTGWTPADSPFDGTLSGSSYTFGDGSDTVLANWDINEYDVTFDNEFDFDNGAWPKPGNGELLEQDFDNNSFRIKATVGQDNNTVHPHVMNIVPGHRYRLTFDYKQNAIVSGAQIQIHFFYYDDPSAGWKGFPGQNANFPLASGEVYNKNLAEEGTITFEFVVPEGYNYGRLRLGTSSVLNADITFSDIYIQDLTRGTIYDSTASEPAVENSAVGTTIPIHGVVQAYNSQIGTNETLDGKLPVISSEYFDFSGWYTGHNGTGTQITTSTTVPAHTLQAFSKWTVHVDYITDGGSYKDSSKAPAGQNGLAIGSSYTIPNYVPYKPGYNFKGWQAVSGDTAVNGKIYWPGDTVTLNANVNLTAVWEEATAALDTQYTIQKFYPGQVYFYKYVPSENQYVSGYTYNVGGLNTGMYLYKDGERINGITYDTNLYGATGVDKMISYALDGGSTYYYGVDLSNDTAADNANVYFQLNEHIIIYDLDETPGSVVVTGEIIGHYNTATPLPDAVRTGYEFGGWENASRGEVYNGSVPASVNQAIINSSLTSIKNSFKTQITLNAVWNIKSYRLTVYAQYNQAASLTEVTNTYLNGATGGTVSVDSSSAGSSSFTDVKYEAYANILANPATGYTFDGWYLNPTLNGTTVTDWGERIPNADASAQIQMADSDCKVYAKFEINTYAHTLYAYNNTADDTATFVQSTVGGTVGFDANAISGETTVTYVHGQQYTMYAKPASGYTFAGWYYGDNSFEDSASYVPTQCTYANGVYSITLTATDSRSYKAKFVVQKYTLYLDANNGELVNNNPSYNEYAGAKVTLNDPTRTGYTFIGWDLTNESNGEAFGTIVNGVYTFGGGNDRAKATWEVSEYPIVIDPNGGTISVVDYYIANGTESGVPATVENVSERVTLNMAYNTQTSISEPTRTGYKFEGWNVTQAKGQFVPGANGSASRYTVGLDDTAVIVANWSINQYRLQVEAYSNTAQADQQFAHSTAGGTVKIGDGASGLTQTENVNYAETRTITATPATGYYFAGWQTSVPTTVDSLRIISTDNPMTTEAMPVGGLIYYAVFRISSFKVTVSQAYNSATAPQTFVEGETGGTATGGGTVNYGLTTPLTATEKTGYRFIGWFDSLDSAQAVSVANPYTPTVTSDLHLYAKFELRQYTVTVTTMANSAAAPETFTEANGCGTITGAGDYYYQTNATLLATANEGYEFVGWYKTADVTGDPVSTEKDYIVPVTETAGYYAKFEVKQSTASVYSVTVDADGNVAQNNVGGDVSLDNVYYAESASGDYYFNGTYTVYAKAHTGYTFENWYRDAALTQVADNNVFDNGGYDSENGYYYRTYHKRVDGAEAVYAKFSVAKYTLDVWAYSNSGAIVGSYSNNATGGTVSITESTYATEVTGNGTQKVTAQVYHGKGVDIVATPATGYTFEGWYTNEELNAFYNANEIAATATMDTNGLSYYAKFEVGKFTIKFDANGGASGSKTEGTAYYATAFEVLGDYTPDRTGWSFGGWALSPTDAEGVYGAGVQIDATTISEWYLSNIATGEVTLYAIWSQDAHGLSVQAAYSTLESGGNYYVGDLGGTVELVDVEFDENDKAILPTGEALEKHLKFTPATGYQLNQWRYNYNAPGNEPSITSWGTQGSGAFTMPNRDLYIVAFFEIGSFDVVAYAYSNSAKATTTYYNNASGGTVKFGETGTNGTVANTRGTYSQTVLAIATPARGFAFGGWYGYNLHSTGEATAESFLIDKIFIQESAELSAVVDDNRVTEDAPYNNKLNVYFAIFNIQAYNATISARTYDVGQDEAAGSGNPTITGGTVGVGLTATADDTWVWLEAVGGNEKTLSGAYYGERVYYQAIPNVGYAFAGWYSQKDAEYYGDALVEEFDTEYSRIMRDADTYLEAKFVPHIFTLALDPNQGTSGNPAEIQVTFNKVFRIESSSTPTRVGFTFMGWSDAPDGEVNEAYNIMISPEIISGWFAQCGPNDIYSIYAVWEEASVTIIFDNQGGNASNPIDISVGSTLPPLAEIPVYDGFVFGGYYNQIGGEGVQYYDAEGKSTYVWNNTSNGTIYALWLTPVLENIAYENGSWNYNYETEQGTLTVTVTDPVTTPSGITANAPDDVKWATSIDPVETDYIDTQKDLAEKINLNHYTQEALTSLLNAATDTDTEEKVNALTQPQANSYVATMAKSLDLDFDANAKKNETAKPSITLYENKDKLNLIKSQTITDKADSANESTYTYPSSTDASSYVYSGKYSYSMNDAVDYYLYTNSKTPVIALEIDDGAVGETIGRNNSSYPTSATIVDNSADKGYIDGSKKTYTTSAVKAAEDIEKAWFNPYLKAGIGKNYDYNAKTVVYLTPEFTSSGTQNEIVYTITPSDNAYIANEGLSTAEISSPVGGFASYDYKTKSTESITVCICYHNSMNGESDEGTNDASGDYMQLYMEQVNMDTWLNQLHIFRTSGGASNWDLPTGRENVYPVNDATYPYEDVGYVLGSFIYVFDETIEPDAAALAAAGDYTGAKEKIIDSISLKGMEAQAAILNRSNALHINSSGTGLGYAEIDVWNLNFYPKQGSYVYGHLVDRWGNVFNRVWKCFNVDQFASTIQNGGGTATYNVFEDGGSNIDYITLDGADVQFVLDSATTYENGVLTTTGNTLTIATGVSNKTYKLTVVDNATNKTTANVTTDGEGKIVLNVDDACANLANGAYTFTLNGETVNLYAGDPAIVRDAKITPVSLIGQETVVTVKTASDALKVQLVEGVTTGTYTKNHDAVTIVENEDGTLTWTIRFKAANGVHEYGVKGRNASGWEDIQFTVSTEVVAESVASAIVLKSVYNAEAQKDVKPVIKARTLAGTQKLQVVYPNGSTLTFNRSDDIVISTVDGIETWALTISAYAKAGEYTVDVIAKYEGKWQKTNAKTSTVTVIDEKQLPAEGIYSVDGAKTAKVGENVVFNVLTSAQTLKVQFVYANTTKTFTASNATVVENADGTKMWTVDVRFNSEGTTDVNFKAKTPTGWTDGEVFGTIEVTK